MLLTPIFFSPYKGLEGAFIRAFTVCLILSPNKFVQIVITGVSGRFPRCENIQEFGDLLLAGEDLVTEDDLRWPPGLSFVFPICFSIKKGLIFTRI
jgi:hypothetical protein